MPNRLTEDKIQAIAENYCNNGYRKTDALIKAGYKESYATSGIGLKLYDNIRVIEAIEAKKAENRQEKGLTVESVRSRFLDLCDRCKAKNDRVNEARCLENLGKHVDFYAKDRGKDNTQPIEQLSPEDIAELKRLAGLTMNIKLKHSNAEKASSSSQEGQTPAEGRQTA